MGTQGTISVFHEVFQNEVFWKDVILAQPIGLVSRTVVENCLKSDW